MILIGLYADLLFPISLFYHLKKLYINLEHSIVLLINSSYFSFDQIHNLLQVFVFYKANS